MITSASGLLIYSIRRLANAPEDLGKAREPANPHRDHQVGKDLCAFRCYAHHQRRKRGRPCVRCFIAAISGTQPVARLARNEKYAGSSLAGPNAKNNIPPIGFNDALRFRNHGRTNNRNSRGAREPPRLRYLGQSRASQNGGPAPV